MRGAVKQFQWAQRKARRSAEAPEQAREDTSLENAVASLRSETHQLSHRISYTAHRSQKARAEPPKGGGGGGQEPGGLGREGGSGKRKDIPTSNLPTAMPREECARAGHAGADPSRLARPLRADRGRPARADAAAPRAAAAAWRRRRGPRRRRGHRRRALAPCRWRAEEPVCPLRPVLRRVVRSRTARRALSYLLHPTQEASEEPRSRDKGRGQPTRP